MTPTQLAERFARGDAFDLIDVREPHGAQIANIAGARLIPLATLGAAMTSLTAAREIVVFCRSGVRNANAVRQLEAAGISARFARRGWDVAVECRGGCHRGDVLEGCIDTDNARTMRW